MSGQLDRMISIDYKVKSIDAASGAEAWTWERLTLCRAEFRDDVPSRSEAVAGGLSVTRGRARVRLRYRSDITADMRVVVHGDSDVIYNIIGGPAEVGGRKRYLELYCERYSS